MLLSDPHGFPLSIDFVQRWRAVARHRDPKALSVFLQFYTRRFAIVPRPHRLPCERSCYRMSIAVNLFFCLGRYGLGPLLLSRWARARGEGSSALETMACGDVNNEPHPAFSRQGGRAGMPAVIAVR